MIRHDVEQGGPEWKMLRLGIPTASQFDKILTPGGKLSASADKYMNTLLAEQLLGVPMDDASSGFMERGNVLEKRALGYYELLHDGVVLEKIGFLTRDDRRVGASPDQLVGKDGLLEIKCPSAPNHVGYMRDAEGIGYKVQVQGQLWIAEREWSDTLSYNPDLPPALVRQTRDDKFIALLAAAVDQFLEAMDEAKEKLQKSHSLFEGWSRRLMRVVA